jgi:hypothetical protein
MGHHTAKEKEVKNCTPNKIIQKKKMFRSFLMNESDRQEFKNHFQSSCLSFSNIWFIIQEEVDHYHHHHL